MKNANDRQRSSPLTPQPMFAPEHFIHDAALDPSPDGRLSIEVPSARERLRESVRPLAEARPAATLRSAA